MPLLGVAVLCCALGGLVHDPAGAPIVGARLALDGQPVSATDAGGHFTFHADPGPHRLAITAGGFGTTMLDRIEVGESTTLDVTLEALAPNRLQTIGTVRVDGRLALSHGAVPTTTITRAALDDAGVQHVVDALEDVPSVTLPRPDAGAPGAVAVVALRGPDPSETLVALDGQILNNTNTGDLDLSQFGVSPFRAIEITEGLGPENATGANTIGGEVNFRSLEPTSTPHQLISASYGSFDTATLVANATGTRGRLGYALAYGNAQTAGPVNGVAATFQNADGSTSTRNLYSGVSARTGLANLVWSFSQRADVSVRYFTIADTRDESAALAGELPGGTFTGPGAAGTSQGIRALQIAARAPLGDGSLQASYAASGTTSSFDGGSSASPYDISYVDRLGTFTLGWQRSSAALDLALGAYVRTESLAVPSAFDRTQSESSQAAYVRTAWNVGPRLRILGSVYDTHYSTFGASLDGRIGAILDLDARSNARFSVGTGFRAPLLAERYVTPLAELQAGLPGSVDQNCVAANGNANLDPEHVTTYELGYGRNIASSAALDASVYRTNLRDPIELAYPLNASCPGGVAGSAVAGQVVPVNVSNAVYQGGTLRLGKRLGAFFVRAEYGINAAYPLAFPKTVANPTSGANLVANQQFAGIPIHVATLGVQYERDGYHASFAANYRGTNNELSAGPYATLNGAIGKRVRGVDFSLGFHNITNAVAGNFTKIGQGVPYPTPSGPLPTDLFVLAPASIDFTVTVRN